MSSVIMPTSGIHETAIIHPSAKIGKDVSVGPYAVIDEDTEIGDGCVIGAHVTIHPYTKIGKNCHFFPGCSIGAVPQDLKFVGEKSYTIIGDGGSFRECCTVHRACGEGNETRIGNNILMMAYTHVAHNCIVGNNVIMSNVATLAGHVIVEDAPEGKIKKSDVTVAKNYLSQDEMKQLNRMVTAYLDFAENMTLRHIPLTMQDWEKRLNSFIEMFDYGILQDAGKVSAEIAKLHAETEFEKYRVIQDRLFMSDFDKYMLELEENAKK